MQMAIGCGREMAGMAKNHTNKHHRVAMCGKLFSKPLVTSGTTKTVVPKIPKNSGSTPTPCLDKAVLAQGGGGVLKMVVAPLPVQRGHTTHMTLCTGAWGCPDTIGQRKGQGCVGGNGGLERGCQGQCLHRRDGFPASLRTALRGQSSGTGVALQPAAGICRFFRSLTTNCGRRFMCLVFTNAKLQMNVLQDDLKRCCVQCPGAFCRVKPGLRSKGVLYPPPPLPPLFRDDRRFPSNRFCPSAIALQPLCTRPHGYLQPLSNRQ